MAASFPCADPGWSASGVAARWKRGLTDADAISFTAREQAEPWQAAGVLGDQRVLEIVESGTTHATGGQGARAHGDWRRPVTR